MTTRQSTSNSTKSTAKKILHVVYFVDSNETKTTSFSIQRIKLVVVLGVAYAILSAISFVVLVLLFRHNSEKGLMLKELKAAHLAQSIVHENLLKEAPFLVASGTGIMLSKQSNMVAEALRNASTVDFNSDELSFAESEQSEQNEAEALQTAEAPKVEEPVNQVSIVSPEPPTPKEQLAPSNNVMNDFISFSQIKAIYSDSESRYQLKFVIQNLKPNAVTLDGTLCAVLKGKNTSGAPVSAFFPISFNPESGNPKPCEKGLRIRFARFRPSEMSIRSEQMSLETVTFHFFSADKHTKHEIKIF
jgi:hypothetical protein